jgi:hypothetical protein
VYLENLHAHLYTVVPPLLLLLQVQREHQCE